MFLIMQAVLPLTGLGLHVILAIPEPARTAGLSWWVVYQPGLFQVRSEQALNTQSCFHAVLQCNEAARQARTMCCSLHMVAMGINKFAAIGIWYQAVFNIIFYHGLVSTCKQGDFNPWSFGWEDPPHTSLLNTGCYATLLPETIFCLGCWAYKMINHKTTTVFTLTCALNAHL